MTEGRIIKALSGFYYVKTTDGIYECRGRGLFRKQNITPLVGDFVQFDINDPQKGYIIEIDERKNELVRPPISNIDQAIIVSSAITPEFSPLLLDRFLVLIEAKRIKPIIFISKMDVITEAAENKIVNYKEDYEAIGYTVELFSSKEPEGLARLDHYLENNVSVIAGQSGVGKSSLLNTLNPELLLKTAEISKSLGRGKHTTRHVELMEVNGGLVADTPGFSALEFTDLELEELPNCFPEIRLVQESCKYRGCMHNKEPKCAVKAAVETGEIKSYRYEHYLRFFDEIQSRKPRY